jgi:hypothetical protein
MVLSAQERLGKIVFNLVYNRKIAHHIALIPRPGFKEAVINGQVADILFGGGSVFGAFIRANPGADPSS